MNVAKYLIDHTTIDWSRALREWAWLLPTTTNVRFLTQLGDVFIAESDGSIHLLDVGTGELRRVANDLNDLSLKLDDPPVARELLLMPVIDALNESGVELQAGECFSFRMIPILGGNYDAENRMALNIYTHFECWGVVHRQLAGTPDGTQVVVRTKRQSNE